jgi:hypothetical protein
MKSQLVPRKTPLTDFISFLVQSSSDIIQFVLARVDVDGIRLGV